MEKNRVLKIPAAGQSTMLQASSAMLSVPSQAVPPFSSCVKIVLNLYCFPSVPHVFVQAVHAP